MCREKAASFGFSTIRRNEVGFNPLVDFLLAIREYGEVKE